MLNNGEMMWTPMSRVGTRGIRPPRWCCREHATTGADQAWGPRPVTLSSEGRPLLVSSQVPWIVRGRLPLRGHRGPGPVRASVHLSQVLVEAGVTPAVHLHGPAPLPTRHVTIRRVPGWHVNVVPRGTEVAVRAVLVRSGPLGAAVQRRPRKDSVVTGALVAGRAVT